MLRRQQPYSSPDAGPIVIGTVKCTNCCQINIPSYNGPNSSPVSDHHNRPHAVAYSGTKPVAYSVPESLAHHYRSHTVAHPGTDTVAHHNRPNTVAHPGTEPVAHHHRCSNGVAYRGAHPLDYH